MINPKLRAKLRRERTVKLCAFLLVVITSMVIILAVPNLLLSFVLAFVVNYLLAPIVAVLERRGLPRQAAIFIPFVATGVLLGFGISRVLPRMTAQLTLLETQLPRYQVELMNLVGSFEGRFKGFFKMYNINFSDSINTWMINRSSELYSVVPSAVSGSLTVLLLTPIFAFFMLHDGRSASRSLLTMVPNNLFETALNLQHRLNEQLGGFIRARFIEAAIVGIVVWLGLQIIDFPYASLLALFAALTNLIPYVGPIIGAVPAILIALITDEALFTQSTSLNLVIVSTIYFIAQLIDIAFIIPLVVAKIVNLHPVTVIIVIIVGSQVMGILGMIIAIPVASAIKLIFQAFYDHLIDFKS